MASCLSTAKPWRSYSALARLPRKTFSRNGRSPRGRPSCRCKTSDPIPLAIGREVEVPNPQRALIRGYRDGARRLATGQDDLGYESAERRQEALPAPDGVE